MSVQISRVKNSIQLLSKTGYTFRRHLSFLPGNFIYDRNLSIALDYCLQTGRYSFILTLKDILDTQPNINFEDFNKELVKAIALDLMPSYQFKKDKKSNEEIADIGFKKIKKHFNKYFDSNDLDYHIGKVNRNLVSKQDQERALLSEDLYNRLIANRKSIRKKKVLAMFFAKILAVLVAAPEAALALFGSGRFNTRGLGTIGSPSFAVNYLLYVDAIYNYLTSFITKKPTKLDDILSAKKQLSESGFTDKKIDKLKRQDDSKLNKLNKLEKWGLSFLLYLTGICLGFLYFNSIYVPFGVILLGIPAASVLSTFCLPLFIAAVFFGLVVAVANIALLKDYLYDTYLEIKDELNTYIAIIKAKEWKKLFTTSNFKKLILASLSILTVVAVQLWLRKEILSFFTQVLGLPVDIAAVVSILLAVLSVVNGVFYGKNVFNGFNLVLDFAGKVFTDIKNWRINNKNNIVKSFYNNTVELVSKSINSVKSFFNSSDPETKLANRRQAINIASKAILIILAVCCFTNAFGVATGVACVIGLVAVKQLAYMLVAFGSFSANLTAANGEVTLLDKFKRSKEDKVDKQIPQSEAAISPDQSIGVLEQPNTRYNLYGFNKLKAKTDSEEAIMERYLVNPEPAEFRAAIPACGM